MPRTTILSRTAFPPTVANSDFEKKNTSTVLTNAQHRPPTAHHRCQHNIHHSHLFTAAHYFVHINPDLMQLKHLKMSLNIQQFCFYIVLFIVTLSAIISTASKYPLFPFNTASLEWSNAWLIATVIDYYGACICFCGVVLSSEPSWRVGGAWVAAFFLLGSPMCCAWVLVWLFKGGGNLRLERREDTRQVM
jgi:hypothetical protein